MLQSLKDIIEKIEESDFKWLKKAIKIYKIHFLKFQAQHTKVMQKQTANIEKHEWGFWLVTLSVLWIS